MRLFFSKNLPPRIAEISADDKLRLEQQNRIKRKREETEKRRKKAKLEKEKKAAAKLKWAEKVKQITPVLQADGKTKQGKASSFAQIRDFLKKKHKVKKVEYMF